MDRVTGPWRTVLHQPKNIFPDREIRANNKKIHVQSISPGKRVRDQIAKDMLSDKIIVDIWSEIASCIASKYEEYSINLLRAICQLWVTSIHLQRDATYYERTLISGY